MLSPPVLVRSRASSTSLRLPLTVDTCASRQSSVASGQCQEVFRSAPLTNQQSSVDARISLSTSSMLHLPSFVSRSLQLLDASNHHVVTPTSAYSDDSILPLSASPTSTSFSDVFSEKQPSAFPSVHARILLVIILFPLTTLLFLLSLASLPVSISWPRTLSDLAQLGRELHSYSQSGRLPLVHVVGVLSVTAIWEHAWSIPGSVVCNVLAGALFHPTLATLLLALHTTIGSLFATLFSRPMAPLLIQWFPRALSVTRNALQGDLTTTQPRSPAWVRLSVLRLIGVIPWSGINIACGVCGVGITDCLLGSFIGALPWTAVTCQIGDILQTVASTPSATPKTVSSLLTSPDILLKLAFLSFLSLAPILARDRLRAWVSRSTSQSDDGKEIQERKFRWVSEWRTKIRIPSRSRSRRSSEEQVEEKHDTA